MQRSQRKKRLTCTELKLLSEVPGKGNADLERGQLVRHMGKKNIGFLPHTTHKINYSKDCKVKGRQLRQIRPHPYQTYSSEWQEEEHGDNN